MHWIDLTIMAVYVVAMVLIGVLSRGEEKTDDYFVASGRLNSLFQTIVVGISLTGTLFSGITFIAAPSVAYSDGILLAAGAVLFCMPVAHLVLRYWFLPRYLSGGWKYPYEIIEHRFGAPTRTVAASLYILMRIGWMAMMLYAPTLAVMAMGRLDDRWFWPILLITGLSNTFYTVISGIRGVIVTEAIQMCVIALGIGGTILFALVELPVPMSVAWTDLAHSGRLSVASFSLDPQAAFTVWTVTLGACIGNLTNYLSDQMSLQRYLATGSARAASRSFFVNVLGAIVILLLLATVGLCLFVHYSHSPDPNLPKQIDQVFPYFVASKLPVGIAGLLLAALLAATSIPSGINTLAGVLTLDFHARIHRNMTDSQRLLWGKIYTLLLGLAATLTAGMLSRLRTVFDLSAVILGVFAGPLLACMVVAVTGWRWPGWAMIVGIFAGWLAGVAVSQGQVAVLWVSPTAALVTVLVAGLLAQIGKSGAGSPPAFAGQPEYVVADEPTKDTMRS